MSDLFELFPTPVLRVPRLLDDSGVRAFRQRFAPAAGQLNHHSGELSHSQILAADADPLLAELSARLKLHGRRAEHNACVTLLMVVEPLFI